jgi:dipeptidase
MKKFILRGVLFVLTFVSISGFSQDTESFTFDCFSMLVGKDATADGSVLFAHNEEDWGDRIVNWYQVPGKQYDGATKISLKNGGTLSQADKTYTYLWLEMPEMEFSDTYMNEWGVTISSDACQSRERDPEITDGGIGYWLRRAMAERARTAREAVKIGGALVEQYGYTSSGRTYCIADPREAWMLSVVKGKHWVAQRVPDDHIAIIPNYYTITTVDLADTLNYYGSDDLVDYAVSKKWYDPEKDGEFNFRLVYSDPGNLENMGNIVRHWSATNKIAPEQYAIDASFPFSFKPKKQIELSDLFEILRNHNEGTEYDKSEHYTKGNPHEFGRAICAKTTQYGFVAQLRTGLPPEIANVLWLAPYRPCVHPFTQWYFGMTGIPDGFSEQDYRSALAIHFDAIPDVFETAPDNKFLAYVKHAQQVDENYKQEILQLRARIQTLETDLLQKQEQFEKKMIKMLSKDPLAARKAITEYCEEQLRR